MAPKTQDSILVVEDSQVLSNVISQRLAQDFQVKAVYQGDDALRTLKEGHGFSAILLDLILPKMDGFEIMRRLKEKGDATPVIIITARPKNLVEKEAVSLGAKAVFNKPLDFPSIISELKKLIVKKKRDVSSDALINDATGKPFPIRRAMKTCFICGFTKVPSFTPIHEGSVEDWSHGPYPLYRPQGGYDHWDQLRTYVTVCPYCFFASSDAQDFGERPDSPYPYSEESKKILARSMSMRKRLVAESQDIDHRFDDPLRGKEQVIDSLRLADKCCNGLILAGKSGAYAQAGIYSTLLGALEHPAGETHYREAFENFENQLKDKNTVRPVLVKTYYFSIILNMLLGRTVLGRDIMRKVELLYADRRAEEVSQEEQEWLMRINHVWKNGVDTAHGREIG